MENNYGYSEHPPNGEKIVRARTNAQIRSWEFPRSIKSLEKFNQEIGKIDYPGIYLLLMSKQRKIYIGEAKNIYNRLKTHNAKPDDKIKDWDKAIIINDGRPATQSLVEELNFFLLKKNLITKLIAEKGQEQVMFDDLKKILTKSKYKINEISAYEGVINGEKVFIRHGSKKVKGWQITFRDVFKNHLQNEDGSLIIPRGGVLYIPFSEIKKGINDPSAFTKNTIDVFFAFEEDNVLLRYKQNEIDVTAFLIRLER